MVTIMIKHVFELSFSKGMWNARMQPSVESRRCSSLSDFRIRASMIWMCSNGTSFCSRIPSFMYRLRSIHVPFTFWSEHLCFIYVLVRPFMFHLRSIYVHLCSIHVPFMFHLCSIHVPMCHRCSIRVPFLLHSCSIHVPFMFHVCSIEVTKRLPLVTT